MRRAAPISERLYLQFQIRRASFRALAKQVIKMCTKYPQISPNFVGISIIFAKTNTHTRYPIPEHFGSGIGYIPDTHTRGPFSWTAIPDTHTRRIFPRVHNCELAGGRRAAFCAFLKGEPTIWNLSVGLKRRYTSYLSR